MKLRRARSQGAFAWTPLAMLAGCAVLGLLFAGVGSVDCKPGRSSAPGRSSQAPSTIPPPRGHDPGSDVLEIPTAGRDSDRTRRLRPLLDSRLLPAELRRLLQLNAQIEDPVLRFEALRLLFGRWARLDGAAAMAHAQSALTPGQRITVMPEIVEQWADADPAAAVHWIAGAAGEDLHESTFAALAIALARIPPGEIVALAQAVTVPATRVALCVGLVEQLKASDPAGAATLVMQMASGPAQADLLGHVVAQWSQDDLAGALEWAKQLPAGEGTLAAYIHLSYAWLEQDPADAANFARSLPPGNEQLLVTLGSEWARQDPQAASAWVRGLPDGEAKAGVLAALVGAWAEHDPGAAAAFAQTLPLGTVRQDAIISAVTAWAARDPATVAEWVAEFPTGRQREYAIENLLYIWTQNDPVAAVAWLQRLPAGPDRDAALHAGAGSLVDAYPDLAARLAAEIRDEALRHRQIERAARAWFVIDPEATRAWLEQSRLPLALKRQFRLEPPS